MAHMTTLGRRELLESTLAMFGLSVADLEQQNQQPVIAQPGETRFETGGPIVGLFEGAAFEEETVQLEAGDWLIVFSDGVSEALSADGEEYGEARIIQTVHEHASVDAQQMLQALFNDVRVFTKGAAQSDDITALVLRYGA